MRAAAGLDGRAAELAIVAHELVGKLVAEIGTQLAETHPALVTRFIPWSPVATWQAIDDCDLVIIPQDHMDPWGRMKSHNRLVEAIRGGRLAVTSPIPSYLELAQYAWVGEDLAEGVRWALSNPQDSLERVITGQQHVATRFSPQRILAQWKRLLTEPTPSRASGVSTTPEFQRTGETKLNLGCGDKILPGYVNVDVEPNRAGRSPDVLCDLHDLQPFDSDTADEVLAVHVVEHFWRWEVVDVLKEWVRVLRPGGRMVLECPNLLTACEEFLRNPAAGSGPGPEGQRTMWVFYGDPAWKDPLMCHRWNYTPQSLGAIMAEAGLVNIRQEPAQYKLRDPRDMRIVGEKPIT
jgi:SAM-dependent methyltransferase